MTMTDQDQAPTQRALFSFPDTQSFIALVLVIAVIALTFAMLFVPVPNSDVFKIMVGGLVTVGFATIINFYFGSSKGSKTKDDTISAQAQALTTAPAPPTTTKP